MSSSALAAGVRHLRGQLALQQRNEESESGPLRRCLVTGESRAKAELLRFVVAPDGRLVADVAGRLPGRGLWLTPRRDILALAVTKRLFARAARQAVLVEDGLARLGDGDTGDAPVRSVDAAIDEEAREQAKLMETNDFKRAYEAFAAKRKPRFEGD